MSGRFCVISSKYWLGSTGCTTYGPEKPILSIWGVGGIGKTKLLEKATEELGQRLAGLRLIALDLDHDRWTPSSSVAEFFWHLRSRLWEAKLRDKGSGAGIETPLFDYLYFALWRAQHPGENFALSDSVLQDLLSTSTLGTTILAEASAKFAAGVYDVATAGSPWVVCFSCSVKP